MCEPITLLMGALGLGSVAMAASAPVQAPPPAVAPAPVTNPVSTSGDTVVRDGSDTQANSMNTNRTATIFREQRKQGTSLGSGLGRSGLAL